MNNNVFNEKIYPKATGLACPSIDEYNDHKNERKSIPIMTTVLPAQLSGMPNILMIIIHDYWFDDKTKTDFFYIRSREISVCPICGNSLKVVGIRERGLIEHEGTEKELIIRRLKCLHCNRIHHELPDIIVPYKRYSSEVIECCICNKIEDLPCELTTIQKLKIWYFFLESYFESTFEALKILYRDYQDLQNEISMFLPLKEKRLHPDGWLKKLVRIIVNLNRWVHTRFAF